MSSVTNVAASVQRAFRPDDSSSPERGSGERLDSLRPNYVNVIVGSDRIELDRLVDRNEPSWTVVLHCGNELG